MTSHDREQITIPPDGKPEAEQPRWRRDFPIDWPQDNYIARRDFTKFLVLTSLAFVAGQFWILLQSFFRKRKENPPLYEIARVDEIPVGGSRVFNYPQEHAPCVLIRLDLRTLRIMPAARGFSRWSPAPACSERRWWCKWKIIASRPDCGCSA